jgi:hypothetical protein
MDVAVFTRSGVERIQRFAFELAHSRPRKKLTLVTKSNAQRHGMVFWDDVFEKVRADFPGVNADKMLVDAMTTRMVLKPETLDTIVATNLHADILSDLAAGVTRHRADGEPAPGTGRAFHVRAHPRVRFRHHGTGHRQPDRLHLDRVHDARSSG